MPRSTRHFPLNLADPRTHGWGGAYLDPSHFTIWLFISMMVMPLLLYEKSIGPILAPAAGWLPLLWCGFGAFLYLRRLAYYHPQFLPRPRVVCDPRGITLHGAFGRIRHQWHWAALADVRYQRGMRRGLLLEPRQGAPVCYRSGLLEHADYVDIVATARPYLRGAVPPQQPIIVPPRFEHCWYELRDGNYNLPYWLLLLVLSWPMPFTLNVLPNWLKEWDTPPPPFLMGWFHSFLIASCIMIGLSGILVIVQEYRVLNAAMPPLLRVADRDGLHFHYRNGCIHSLAWQDIRDMQRVHSSSNYYYDDLNLYDRLGHCYHIDSFLTIQDHDYNLVLTETLDLFTAIRDGKALPPLRTPEITNVLPSERFLFWINTLLACFFIPATIQKSLHMQTWLTMQFDDLFPLPFIAQGALNTVALLFSLIIRENFRRK